MKKMKKMLCVVAVLSVLLLMVCTGAYAANGPVDQDGAKAVALEDAGVKEKDTSKLRIERDKEDGVVVYEVEFRADGCRYEYVVDAENGRILERDIKRSPGTDEKNVDMEGARQIALESAGLKETDAFFAKAKQKKDDGRQIFDLKFYVEGDRVYEYEIDLLTGTILEESWELWDEEDAHNYKKMSGSRNEDTDTSNVISLEEAKAAALQNAGKSEEDVTLNKAKLTKEDGRLVYDIEFYEVDGFEYEYEIDALTGEVLSFEMERWDKD